MLDLRLSALFHLRDANWLSIGPPVIVAAGRQWGADRRIRSVFHRLPNGLDRRRRTAVLTARNPLSRIDVAIHTIPWKRDAWSASLVHVLLVIDGDSAKHRSTRLWLVRPQRLPNPAS